MQAASTLSLPRVLVAAGGLYTAQSTIGGLTFLGLPAALRASGMAMEHIGLLSLIMLIWAFKFLWAVPVERWRIRADGGAGRASPCWPVNWLRQRRWPGLACSLAMACR
ncbi:hypothetical protein [Pannonibacter phragmitetus]|uniref:Uncharacterized protein n=1 Tax=Pannonibacter phragmitetus TaxID=121719 RepID=A0A0U3PPA7_9HYPH|nr:hypothetical protein [Pannonibacter phragmitetus]ALV30611.1 hypothetical protein APZ00_25745 [Pannonibacter phragmitetus]